MKNKIPSLVTVLILTLITSVMWIGFGVYRTFTEKPDPAVAKEIVQDFDPNLDREVIEKIKGRIFLGENEIPETLIQQVSSPTPSPNPTVTPGPTETPNSTFEATPTP